MLVECENNREVMGEKFDGASFTVVSRLESWLLEVRDLQVKL